MSHLLVEGKITGFCIGSFSPRRSAPTPTANLDRSNDRVYENVTGLVRAVIRDVQQESAAARAPEGDRPHGEGELSPVMHMASGPRAPQAVHPTASEGLRLPVTTAVPDLGPRVSCAGEPSAGWLVQVVSGENSCRRPTVQGSGTAARQGGSYV